MLRQNRTNGEIRRIPDVAYNVYRGKFEEPQENEGFREVLKVKFSPNFENRKHEDLFKQWTSTV